MFFRYVLLLSVGLVALDARADFNVAENSAYKVETISKDVYDSDTSGRVFKDYTVDANGALEPHYYRYEFNTDKVYEKELTLSGEGRGDGQVGEDGKTAMVAPGLGIKNPAGLTMYLIGPVLYKDSKYEYDYTGDGASVIVQGGVLYNEGVITVKDGDTSKVALDADFIGNMMSTNSTDSSAVHIDGTVMANKGQIGLVKGDFIQNKAVGNNIDGGVVYNATGGYIQGFQGDFISNEGIATNTHGGAIYNAGTIDDISGNFIANKVTAVTQANGGAIQNNGDTAHIQSIAGNFVDNKVISELEAWGGAIDNAAGVIDEISGDFNNNVAEAHGEGAWAIGGAISNQGQIKGISADFVGNSAQADSIAYGGAIYHDSSSGLEDALQIVNSNFYNNSVTAADEAVGGAIWGNYVKVIADGQNSEFRGNTANGESNAVYMEGDSRKNGVLALSAKNGGAVIFDDNVDGWRYDIDILGDGKDGSEVVLNSRVDNVSNLSLKNDSVMHLGTAAEVNTMNYSAADGGVLKLDVRVDRENNNVNNGVIRVAGDIQGETTVIVNSLNREELDNRNDAYTMFIEAANDNPETYSNFKIGRVTGSPYMWKSVKNYKGEEGDTVSNWYLALKDRYDADDSSGSTGGDNTGGDDDANKEYAPEVAAYVAMQSAAVEQNRGINRQISDALRANRNKGCCDKKFSPKRQVWFDADYTYAEIDAPSEMDAKIKGVTAGFDLAADTRHRLGLFGSYRQGDYDLTGKGDYRSTLGSKMDIDSYLGGLYYSYGGRNWAALATVFAGKQDINVNTDDRLAKADTSALQYGAGLEVARKFYLPYAWIIEPSLGLYYTALDMDGFSDNVGKTVDFDLMHYVEAELGLRFEHLFCWDGWTSKVYAKPSVIQTYANGGKTKITGLKQADTYKNQTLGKMEIGAKFGLTPALSAYTSANYTFGTEYQAYGVDAGLTYAW
ncbi:MAG: autotransporter domain-containing protein [Acetobacter sp.]|nr:autotransporter domain-containing protein [Acetobacter sp.]